MPTLVFKDPSVSIEVEPGTTVLEAALDHHIPLYHTCGGNASCSTCRVRILEGAENLSAVEDAEAQVLDSFDLKPPFRLGCQAAVREGKVVLEIPSREKAPRPNKTPPVPAS